MSNHNPSGPLRVKIAYWFLAHSCAKAGHPRLLTVCRCGQVSYGR